MSAEPQPAEKLTISTEFPQRDYVIPDLVSGYRGQSKKPQIAAQILAWFNANNAAGDFGVIIKNGRILKKILDYENGLKAARQKKDIPHKRMFEITPLPGLVVHMRLDPAIVRSKSKTFLQYGHMLGTFRVRLTGSHDIFIISWGASAKDSGEMAIGTQKALNILFERLDTQSRRLITTAPAKGLWDIQLHRSMQGVIPHFVRRKPQECSERFMSHPVFPVLKADMDDFYRRIEWWTKNAQPGMRKVLLVGPPGTGKTSIAIALADHMASTCLVVYASSGEGLIAAADLAAAKQRRTIIIAEELDLLQRPASTDLNWLDGSATPRNTSGTYLISTTNFPKRVDPRILKRPGRIDSVISVGALGPKDAGGIAGSFIPDDALHVDLKGLGRVLDRTTPSEIREILNIAFKSLDPGESLSLERIAQARADLKRTMSAADSMADDDPEQRELLHNKFGPRDEFDFDDAPPKQKLGAKFN